MAHEYVDFLEMSNVHSCLMLLASLGGPEYPTVRIDQIDVLNDSVVSFEKILKVYT
jgi:hypothetical protein